MSGKVALIAGASGLVGSNVLDILSNDSVFGKIKLLV
jgi:aspartate-semialdehyde dehydrogenase